MLQRFYCYSKNSAFFNTKQIYDNVIMGEVNASEDLELYYVDESDE